MGRQVPHERGVVRSLPHPQLPPPSFKARAFMPEDKPDPMAIEPDDSLRTWSNRLQARAEFNASVASGGAQ